MRREQGEGSSYGQSRIMAKPKGCVWLGKCDAVGGKGKSSETQGAADKCPCPRPLRTAWGRVSAERSLKLRAENASGRPSRGVEISRKETTRTHTLEGAGWWETSSIWEMSSK